MKEKLTKQIMIFSLTLLFSISLLVSAMPSLADPQNPTPKKVDPWGGQKPAVNSALGLGEKDPRAIIASVINVILGFLGIIAVVIILVAGFKWMTAGGSEDKIGEARKMMTAAVIGLVVILAAWGIATFVIDTLLKATNTPGSIT